MVAVGVIVGVSVGGEIVDVNVGGGRVGVLVVVGGRGVNVLVGRGDAVWVGVGTGAVVQAARRRVRRRRIFGFM
jgi:hypothetical protein